MSTVTAYMDYFRLYTGQILSLMFLHWLTMLPFAFFAVRHIVKLLRKVY